MTETTDALLKQAELREKIETFQADYKAYENNRKEYHSRSALFAHKIECGAAEKAEPTVSLEDISSDLSDIWKAVERVQRHLGASYHFSFSETRKALSDAHAMFRPLWDKLQAATDIGKIDLRPEMEGKAP